MSTNPLAPDPLTDIDGPRREEPGYNQPIEAPGSGERPEDEVPEEDPEDEPLAEPS